MAGRGGIILHTEEDFKMLRAAGRLAASTLDMITPYVKPGVTTGELDRSAFWIFPALWKKLWWRLAHRQQIRWTPCCIGMLRHAVPHSA